MREVDNSSPVPAREADYHPAGHSPVDHNLVECLLLDNDTAKRHPPGNAITKRRLPVRGEE